MHFGSQCNDGLSLSSLSAEPLPEDTHNVAQSDANALSEESSGACNISSFTVKLDTDLDEEVADEQFRASNYSSNFISHCTLETSDNTVKPEQSSPDQKVSEDLEIDSKEGTSTEQELFNSFHYWRTPIPEIDLDLELCQTEAKTSSPHRPVVQKISSPVSPNITMATRKELEEMIENLEPHIDDPDVKGNPNVYTLCILKLNFGQILKKNVFLTHATSVCFLNCFLEVFDLKLKSMDVTKWLLCSPAIHL